jgi:hypothetical protein
VLEKMPVDIGARASRVSAVEHFDLTDRRAR